MLEADVGICSRGCLAGQVCCGKHVCGVCSEAAYVCMVCLASLNCDCMYLRALSRALVYSKQVVCLIHILQTCVHLRGGLS
jgi:hypothetical protein